jgi:hypothetical protein
MPLGVGVLPLETCTRVRSGLKVLCKIFGGFYCVLTCDTAFSLSALVLLYVNPYGT